MGDYEKTFDWVEFPEGRARFSGATRGIDERGHETFALEVNSIQYFGEIDQEFLPDRHNFNVVINSFGYIDEEFAGATSESWASFTADELKIVQILVLKLVQTGLGFEDRPSALDELPNSRFMGKVIFRDGWALQRAGDNSSSPAQSARMETHP